MFNSFSIANKDFFSNFIITKYKNNCFIAKNLKINNIFLYVLSIFF